MSDEMTLLPCPFCGGEAEPFNPFDTTDGTWTVLCSECASSVGFEQTRAEAIAAWNTRAATTIGKVQVEVEPVLHGTLTAEQVREAVLEKLPELRRSDSEGGETMSMLSSQADELRTLADKLRSVRFDDRANYVENIETLYLAMGAMREAADTIEGLRKQVAKCQIAELKADYDTSRYFELFGTPERAARTLAGIACDDGGCEGCPLYDANCSYDSDTMLKWLRGDAE